MKRTVFAVMLLAASEIASLADALGGDVVYPTTIELATLPPGLRAGMTVEVQFGN